MNKSKNLELSTKKATAKGFLSAFRNVELLSTTQDWHQLIVSALNLDKNKKL